MILKFNKKWKFNYVDILVVYLKSIYIKIYFEVLKLSQIEVRIKSIGLQKGNWVSSSFLLFKRKNFSIVLFVVKVVYINIMRDLFLQNIVLGENIKIGV